MKWMRADIYLLFSFCLVWPTDARFSSLSTLFPILNSALVEIAGKNQWKNTNFYCLFIFILNSFCYRAEHIANWYVAIFVSSFSYKRRRNWFMQYQITFDHSFDFIYEKIHISRVTEYNELFRVPNNWRCRHRIGILIFQAQYWPLNSVQ